MANHEIRNKNEIENGKNDELDDIDKERKHFFRIVNAFSYYRIHSLRRVSRAEKNFNALSDRHKNLVPQHLEQIQNIKLCIDHNYEIIKLIIKNTDRMFENVNHAQNGNNQIQPSADFDMDKVKTTLKQFVRDWSSDGATERQNCYEPVIKEVIEKFPVEKIDPSEISILVPGAGLGRLAYEFAKLGYNCQGNEWSLFMLFASNFVLNRCHGVNCFTLYPWVHQYCNNLTAADQTKGIKFPDVNPSDLPQGANFSMAAGDFLEVYTEENTWDCIATVFFIDTAHNIIDYVETIYKILKPGGYWINIGPLLYHFADMLDEASIELSYEDLRDVIYKVGFTILKEHQAARSGYTQNPNSMLKYIYDSVFFVAKKPE